MRHRALAPMVIAVVVFLSAGWLFAHEGRERSHALAPAADASWAAECSSCHMLYPPGLLPARSWRSMMDGLDEHFGDNASLDPATRNAIAAFLDANAADRVGNRRSAKIAQSIPASETPLRFTTTRYFERQHHELRASVWKREKVGSAANCVACHGQDAEKGVFDEDMVSVPK